MAAVVELLPVTRIVETEWSQDLESVVDVSGYTEAAVLIQVLGMTVDTPTTTIAIDTGIDNRSDQFMQIAGKEFTAAPGDLPDVTYFYLAGSTNGSSTASGFARYLRMRVVQQAGGVVTLAAKAVFKP